MVVRVLSVYYIVMFYTIVKIATSVYSTDCKEYFTLFKEMSCADTNSIEIKPIEINLETWNASRFDWNPDYRCIDTYPSEECFFEITCERIETVCEKQFEESIEITTEIRLSSSQADMELLAPETTTINAVECTEFYTIFEERSCDVSTEIKPALINLETWNASRFDWNPDYRCIDTYPSEECFFEITCERIETVCEKQFEESIEITTEIRLSSSQADMELLAPETTTVNAVECSEFYTIFEERSCDTSTEIKPALIDLKTWNISRFNSNLDNYCLGTYPSKECFLELTCERVETVCERHVEESIESGLKNDDSDMSYYNNTLIAIGVVSSVILSSLFLNYAVSKYKDFIQSGTYRLPNSPAEIAESEL